MRRIIYTLLLLRRFCGLRFFKLGKVRARCVSIVVGARGSAAYKTKHFAMDFGRVKTYRNVLTIYMLL